MKNKSYNKKQYGTLKLNLIVPFIGIILSIIFGIFLIVSICSGAELFICVIFGTFLMLSLIMVLTLNQRIDYTPLGFSYRDMLRITHEYEYSQVKKISYGKDCWIKVGHRIILIDAMADNGKKFTRIAMQYSPNAVKKTESQSKLFNGNISSPGEFVFIWIFFAVAIILFGAFMLNMTKEIKLEDLSNYTDTIVEYKFDKTDDDGSKRMAITLSSNEGTFVTWDIEDGTQDYENFKKDVSDGKPFQLYFHENDLKNEVTRILVLSCGERNYLSIDRENEENREIRRLILCIVAIFLIMWGIYVAVSVYVMRNAERFPRAIKFFVKPSYIIKKDIKH
jgi:hypothetical protein